MITLTATKDKVNVAHQMVRQLWAVRLHSMNRMPLTAATKVSPRYSIPAPAITSMTKMCTLVTSQLFLKLRLIFFSLQAAAQEHFVNSR